MPRTKVPAKKSVLIKKEIEDCEPEIEQAIKIWRDNYEKRKKLADTKYLLLQQQMSLKFHMISLNMTKTDLEKTVAEYGASQQSLINSLIKDFSSPSLLPTSSFKKLKKKRSWSCSDEGYLTAESESSASTSKRVSRSRTKKFKASSISRSKSENNKQKQITSNLIKTPCNKIPESFAMVTPKMKPNTPQIVLRRPKVGEVAISLQGSPLMVNAVPADQTANVNIPLVDGRMLSIQPQRGLRMSQIPALDEDTRRQIEALRDNLNKVCGALAIGS